jgi:hypothetical protein
LQQAAVRDDAQQRPAAPTAMYTVQEPDDVSAEQGNTASADLQPPQQRALVPARPFEQQADATGTAGKKRVVAIQQTVITQTMTGADGHVLQHDCFTVREMQRPGAGSKQQYAAGKHRQAAGGQLML